MDQNENQVKRIAELEAALEERDAIMATAIRITKQMAFGEAAQVLLKLAHGARPMGLAEAAKVVADMARDSGRKPPHA
jgi:hypothetical protein